ncbi:MAG: SspB family protein [Methyloligellaceae bacterium]
MTGDQIHYEQLAQDALRSVIGTVLTRVEKTGKLPGEHHFFIAFDTQADGVNISKRLKEQYPEEMTIVMQHQFWDLRVEEEFFEVRLSFNNVPELLVVPYSAIRVFFDPSVPYGLQFGSENSANENSGSLDLVQPEIVTNVPAEPARSLVPETGSSKVESDPEPEIKPEPEQDQNKEESSQTSADIVELDTFRKK